MADGSKYSRERTKRDRKRIFPGLPVLLALIAVASITGFALDTATLKQDPIAKTNVSAASPNTLSRARQVQPAKPILVATKRKAKTRVARKSSSKKRSSKRYGSPAYASRIDTPTVGEGEKLIVISKKQQKVFVYESSQTPSQDFLCSSGKTWPPVGIYKVYSKSPQSYAPKYGLAFKHMVRFWKPKGKTPVGFHSLVYNRKGVVDADKLGKPVSHGCVRLDFPMAEFIYNWAPMGTRVAVVD